MPVHGAKTKDHPDVPLHLRAADDPRPPEHLRTYGRDFPERMAAVGFRVRVATAADLAAAAEQRRFGIESGAGAIHFGTKP